jgi:N-hydroxyarylamine O-acetyltransferase
MIRAAGWEGEMSHPDPDAVEPRLDSDAVDRYLGRIGLDADEIRGRDRDTGTLARLQAAHVRHVPFENLSIVGDPFGDAPGEGVSLEASALYRKIVERERGGYCFELNGLFTALLDALGFDVHRAAAMIVPEDGEHTTPANHHAIVVTLDRRYVVDVGMGSPRMRRPAPIGGGSTPADPAGAEWRVVPNDRPIYGLTTEYRNDGGWEPRYVFDPTPRDLSYFGAACDYLATAPESPFTEGVTVQVGTEEGWRELTRETFARVENGERTERDVPAEEWDDLLAEAFDLCVPEESDHSVPE